MNSEISLIIVKSILNCPFKYLKKEYVTLLNSYIPYFEGGNDDGSFYNVILYDAYYQLNTYKSASGKNVKKSNKIRDKCVIYLLKHYIYYLYKTGKDDAKQVENLFEEKTGAKFDFDLFEGLITIFNENPIDTPVTEDTPVTDTESDDIIETAISMPNGVMLFNFVLLSIAMLSQIARMAIMVY